jgi:hypothetical protein
MKIAADSHQKIEEFFQLYFKSDSLVLPKFQIHCGFWARTICRTFKIHGITLGRHVFVDPVFVTIDRAGKIYAPFELIVHEATHVLQYAREGFLGFLIGYLKEWFAFLREQGKRDVQTRWQAYYAIGHEMEAREAASAYAQWKVELAQAKKESRQIEQI